MANWVWTALASALLVVDWAFGSWLLKFKPLWPSDARRWSRIRASELTVGFIFLGVAIVQLIGLTG